ncbi:hypothetical protein RJT34_32735 [Clitoria ternatea]|uniref:Lipocalin/cytosolic fatty-acid binding domain-containing protein n=1 Tax=Clitoria ternatea TaxID=43366 RepID=A0AAN9I4V3_CLITE
MSSLLMVPTTIVHTKLTKSKQRRLSVNALASGVELKRCMGRWYEIASVPFWFEPCDGVNTRATYSVRNDGTVDVLNETWSGGKRGFIQGTGFKVDPNSDDIKLKVKFYVPPFLPIFPVVGDFWVLYVDHHYHHAVIGQPSRKFLWILSRDTHLGDEIYKELVERAKNEGYDVTKLRKTPQSDPPSAEEGPQDTKGICWDARMTIKLKQNRLRYKTEEARLAHKLSATQRHLSEGSISDPGPELALG